MTNSGGLQDSLASMGFVELAVASFALFCYSLVLNGLLATKARTYAAGFATVAAAALVALTDPWMNGMIIVAMGVAAMGVFVGAAWAVSAMCARYDGQPHANRPVPVPELSMPDALPDPMPAAVPARRAVVPVQAT